jgi:hypothetical protein
MKLTVYYMVREKMSERTVSRMGIHLAVQVSAEEPISEITNAG